MSILFDYIHVYKDLNFRGSNEIYFLSVQQNSYLFFLNQVNIQSFQCTQKAHQQKTEFIVLCIIKMIKE